MHVNKKNPYSKESVRARGAEEEGGEIILMMGCTGRREKAKTAQGE